MANQYEPPCSMRTPGRPARSDCRAHTNGGGAPALHAEPWTARRSSACALRPGPPGAPRAQHGLTTAKGGLCEQPMDRGVPRTGMPLQPGLVLRRDHDAPAKPGGRSRSGPHDARLSAIHDRTLPRSTSAVPARPGVRHEPSEDAFLRTKAATCWELHKEAERPMQPAASANLWIVSCLQIIRTQSYSE